MEYKDYSIMKQFKRSEWLKRLDNYWNYKSSKIHIYIKKYEIYEFDFGENVGCELSGRHYGVVLKDSKEENPLVTVLPLKTYRPNVMHESVLILGKINLPNMDRITCCCVNQIVCLDKMRIFAKGLINNGQHKLELTEEQQKLLNIKLMDFFK